MMIRMIGWTIVIMVILPLFPPSFRGAENVHSLILFTIFYAVCLTLKWKKRTAAHAPNEVHKPIWEEPACIAISISLACYLMDYVISVFGLVLFMIANVIFAIVAAYATIGVTKMLKRAS